MDYKDLKPIPGFSRYRCDITTGNVYSFFHRSHSRTRTNTLYPYKKPIQMIPQQIGRRKLYYQFRLTDDEFKTRAVMQSHVVYAAANGKWPEKQIHHIDGCPANNAASNLQEIDQLEHFKLHVQIRKTKKKAND